MLEAEPWKRHYALLARAVGQQREIASVEIAGLHSARIVANAPLTAEAIERLRGVLSRLRQTDERV